VTSGEPLQIQCVKLFVIGLRESPSQAVEEEALAKV
jgi:hypothetical protein